MDIPDFFTDIQKISTYDFNLDSFIDSEIDKSFYIQNLSVPGNQQKYCEEYFKSILLGYNHIYITKIIEKLGGLDKNISLPLINKWNGQVSIDNLVIVSNPKDASRLIKKHIKKAPIFKSLLDTSIISTTDNEDWKNQRNDMNMAFLPNNLKSVFNKSLERASKCELLLKQHSNHYEEAVNMSDFFLNETQAQLQLAMFGYSPEFEEQTNKKIRNAFAGIETDYLQEFSQEALKETFTSEGPISKLFSKKTDIKKNIGNVLLFAFAGHDTTGHTLTWLLYELCKNPKYKQKLIDEIDQYWRKYPKPLYETFDELPFMTKCIAETLRLWPALANGTYRELESDDTVMGHSGEPVKLKKGTYCQFINWTRHRNPDLWDKPDTFNPEREFTDNELWNHQGFGLYNVVSERYSPFTYSPRNCLGKNFSHMEMRLILLHIFKNLDFSLDLKQSKTVNDPKYMGINLFTLGPKSIRNDELLGMYLLIHQRKSKL